MLFLSPIQLTSRRLPEVNSTPEKNDTTESIASNLDLDSIDFTVSNPGGAFEGYTIFAVSQLKDSTVNNTIVIVDMDGNIVKQRNIGKLNAFDCMAEFIDPYTVMVGTPLGPAFWNIQTDAFQNVGYQGHHEYELNPNANTIFTFRQYLENINGTNYLYDRLIESDYSGNIVWSLNVSDFIPPSWWCPYHDTASGYLDISHSNTIFYDVDEDVIYYNSRNTNTFFKLNHTTGSVIWALGEHGNFTLYDQSGSVRKSLFYHAHSLEKIGPNKFIIFDNDLHDQEHPEDQRSKIVEIEINETSMTANETWSWAASPSYWSMGWGDADYLPNGNRLGTFGYWSASIPAIIEVNPEGNIVWEFDFPKGSGAIYGTYRAERFRFTPSLNAPSDINILSGDDLVIPWNAWYNYKTKQSIPGTYHVYINDVEVNSDSFTFEKYWQPTNLTMDFGSLPDGEYNITLEVFNDFGQRVTDTVIIHVGPVFLTRSGPTEIELGQMNSTITWSGYTTVPAYYNLTINGFQILFESWSGDDIVFNLSSLVLGSHYFHLQIQNATHILFEDSFWIHVYLSSAPLILDNNTNSVIEWSMLKHFTWHLYDETPKQWDILINGTVVLTEPWLETNFTVDWDLPLLPEGYYNITFIAYDWANYRTFTTNSVRIIPPIIPVIASVPTQTFVLWGSDNVSLDWEIHGATTWRLWKNGDLYKSGSLSTVFLSLNISTLRSMDWIPGRYNLTMVAINNEDAERARTSWLDIVLDLGDPYGDAVVTSQSIWFEDGNNSLNAPDGLYTKILEEYGAGYITIDMGAGEEIIDGSGDDFSIIATGGTYAVSVTNDLDDPLINLQTGTGNHSYDLSDFGIASVRYVRITYVSGGYVDLDAIVAVNYNRPITDDTSPTIYGPTNQTIAVGSHLLLNWTARDQTPWNYTIYLNGVEVDNGLWGLSNITYSLTPSTVGQLNVTIIVYDMFGNYAIDVIFIQVVDPLTPLLIISVLSSISVVTVMGIYYMHKRLVNS